MKLLKGDCLELVKEIPDNSVDMILTDPPYSSGGLFAVDRKKDTRNKYCDNSYNGASRFQNFSGDNMDQRSFTEFMRTVFFKSRMKCKAGAICAVFTDWRQLPAVTDAFQMAGWVWRGVVVWNKGNSRNIPGRFRNDCEFIVWGSNGKLPLDRECGSTNLPNDYKVIPVNSKHKHHQTEKPVELLEKLLAICPNGGTVFDPFMGSGSTGVACVNTGRNFIGIELDEKYFEIAKQRISEVERA